MRLPLRPPAPPPARFFSYFHLRLEQAHNVKVEGYPAGAGSFTPPLSPLARLAKRARLRRKRKILHAHCVRRPAPSVGRIDNYARCQFLQKAEYIFEAEDDFFYTLHCTVQYLDGRYARNNLSPMKLRTGRKSCASPKNGPQFESCIYSGVRQGRFFTLYLSRTVH